jgi:NAD(P)-dependent dehydrogenase (short-subunit alcohol dehydrogenase family)
VPQAPLWGLGRVLQHEHPELRCGLLDLDPERPSDEATLLALALRDPQPEPQLCLRRGQRLGARLRPMAARSGPAPSVALSPEGTYMVTGGLGGLGLEVARWLAARGAKHLLLLGRNPPSQAAAAVVQELEAAGTRVVVAQADVSARASLEALLSQTARELPPLRGIVHCAAVLDDGVLLEQSQERLAGVMAPKATGAWNLHELSQGLPLDFFVLFSSAAALLGPAGQGSYAAANAFLDWRSTAERRGCLDRASSGAPGPGAAWPPGWRRESNSASSSRDSGCSPLRRAWRVWAKPSPSRGRRSRCSLSTAPGCAPTPSSGRPRSSPS